MKKKTYKIQMILTIFLVTITIVLSACNPNTLGGIWFDNPMLVNNLHDIVLYARGNNGNTVAFTESRTYFFDDANSSLNYLCHNSGNINMLHSVGRNSHIQAIAVYGGRIFFTDGERITELSPSGNVVARTSRFARNIEIHQLAFFNGNLHVIKTVGHRALHRYPADQALIYFVNGNLTTAARQFCVAEIEFMPEPPSNNPAISFEHGRKITSCVELRIAKRVRHHDNDNYSLSFTFFFPQEGFILRTFIVGATAGVYFNNVSYSVSGSGIRKQSYDGGRVTLFSGSQPSFRCVSMWVIDQDRLFAKFSEGVAVLDKDGTVALHPIHDDLQRVISVNYSFAYFIKSNSMQLWRYNFADSSVIDTGTKLQYNSNPITVIISTPRHMFRLTGLNRVLNIICFETDTNILAS